MLFLNDDIIKCDVNNINGVSFIKKKKHFIVKVWTADTRSIKFSDKFCEIILISSGIFQKHQKNIKRDHRKNTIYNYRRY